MKTSSFIYAALLAILPSTGAFAQQDSLAIEGSEALGAKYTISIRDLKLKEADGEIIVRVAHPFGGSCYGVRLGIKADCLLSYGAKDTIVIANRFQDGLDAHTYTFASGGTLNVNIYRDNVLLAVVMESSVTPYAGATIFSPENAEEGYTVDINPTEFTEINERDFETNTAGMLPSTLKNLIEDPFFNHGFTYSGAYAENREGIYTQQAIYTGWGSEAYIDTDAFSGKACARLEGQAVNPSQGASLDVLVSLKENTPYLIRAMVKSNGYKGKISISNCNSYIPVPDTQGEWKQIEGVLTPSSASTQLSVNNADFVNDGTLWIDNLEIYEGYTSTTSARLRTEIPYLMVEAGTTFATRRESNIYALGLTDDGTQCGMVDTSLVHAPGCMILKKRVEGSQLYAMHFPGELAFATVTGYYDGFSHNGEQLEYGLDYAVIKYEAPRFYYLDTETPLTAGNYMIQFVDNLDGTDVTLTFNGNKETQPSRANYRLEGNPYPAEYTPEGKFLKFNVDTQRFTLTEGESLKPFEAYIATDETVPVNQIVPNISSTSISRTVSDNGTAISVRNTTGGIIIYTKEKCNISIYGIDGRLLRNVDLHEGDNMLPMSRGIYIVGHKKVAVH